METMLPMAQDLQAHLPFAIHHTTSSVFTPAELPSSGIIDLTHSLSSVTSAVSNNVLASNDFAIGDTAASLWSEYRKALDAEPLKVKIITGCMLAILGDAIAQSRTPEEYNKKRAVAFVAFDGVWRTVQQVTYGPIIRTCNGQFTTGILGSLPFLHVQETLMKEENRFVLGAIEQTLVSQLILIPLLYYPIFYSVTGIVQNLTVEETINRAKETFIMLMKRNLLFWIPVQFGAFYFVEENLQIPVLTAAGLIWTVILSVSAGNVNQSTEEDDFDGAAIEEKMVSEVGATKRAVGLKGRPFFSSSNVTGNPSKTTEEAESAEVGNRRK